MFFFKLDFFFSAYFLQTGNTHTQEMPIIDREKLTEGFMSYKLDSSQIISERRIRFSEHSTCPERRGDTMWSSICSNGETIFITRSGGLYEINHQNEGEMQFRTVAKLEGSRPAAIIQTETSISTFCGNNFSIFSSTGNHESCLLDANIPPSTNTLLSNSDRHLLFYKITGNPPDFSQSVWFSSTEGISCIEIPLNDVLLDPSDGVIQGMIIDGCYVLIILQSISEDDSLDRYMVAFEIRESTETDSKLSYSVMEVDADTLSIFQIEENTKRVLMRYGDDLAVCRPFVSEVVFEGVAKKKITFAHEEQLPGMGLISSSRPRCCRLVLSSNGMSSFAYSFVALIEDCCVTVFSRLSPKSTFGSQIFLRFDSLTTGCSFRKPTVGGNIELLVSSLTEFHQIKLNEPKASDSCTTEKILSEEEERRIAAVLSANADW